MNYGLLYSHCDSQIPWFQYLIPSFIPSFRTNFPFAPQLYNFFNALLTHIPDTANKLAGSSNTSRASSIGELTRLIHTDSLLIYPIPPPSFNTNPTTRTFPPRPNPPDRSTAPHLYASKLSSHKLRLRCHWFQILRRIRRGGRRGGHHRTGTHLSRTAYHVSAAEKGHRHTDRVLSQEEVQSAARQVRGGHFARGHRAAEAIAQLESGLDGHFEAGDDLRRFARQAGRSVGSVS